MPSLNVRTRKVNVLTAVKNPPARFSFPFSLKMRPKVRSFPAGVLALTSTLSPPRAQLCRGGPPPTLSLTFWRRRWRPKALASPFPSTEQTLVWLRYFLFPGFGSLGRCGSAGWAVRRWWEVVGWIWATEAAEKWLRESFGERKQGRWRGLRGVEGEGKEVLYVGRGGGRFSKQCSSGWLSRNPHWSQRQANINIDFEQNWRWWRIIELETGRFWIFDAGVYKFV